MRLKPTYYECGPSNESSTKVLNYLITSLFVTLFGYLGVSVTTNPIAQTVAGLVCVCVGTVGVFWALELLNRSVIWTQTRRYTNE